MALNYSLNNFLLKAKQAFKNNNIRYDGRYTYINSSRNIYISDRSSLPVFTSRFFYLQSTYYNNMMCAYTCVYTI